MQATPGEIKSFRSSAERIADIVVVVWRLSQCFLLDFDVIIFVFY